MEKTLTLNFTDYRIEGEVRVIDWYDREGMLYMDSYHVDELDIEQIKEGINDGGFGVQKIISAAIDIYENYEGTYRFLESMEIEL